LKKPLQRRLPSVSRFFIAFIKNTKRFQIGFGFAGYRRGDLEDMP